MRQQEIHMSTSRRHEAPRHAVLVSVQGPDRSDAAAERSLNELEQLLRGLGIRVQARVVQKRQHPTSTYVGEGKLRDLARLTGGSGKVSRIPMPSGSAPRAGATGLVVVDDELSPGQQRGLEQATAAEVLDRTAVILRVFERRARTREAMLEVELARLTYELPRIREDASLGDREGGGGRASRGNTNVALAKQRSRTRIAELRRELAGLQDGAAVRRQRRASAQKVAIVGYTNAGKSSLMRALTGSDVLVEDKLFATLDTTVRTLTPPSSPPILIADTVGFIERLPHPLLASFKSTLDEANEASLLLFVVDASDLDRRRQLEVTRQTVEEIGAGMLPHLVVLNKIDRVSEDDRRALCDELPLAIQVSAFSSRDVAALRQRLIDAFDRELETATFEVSYDRQSLFAELRDQVRVLAESYGESLTVTVRAAPALVERLRRRLAEVTAPSSLTTPEPSEAQLVELAARHGLAVDADAVHINEAGLDYRVAFVRAADGEDWVLRVPRSRDAAAKLSDEGRILEFVRPRLSVAVPIWLVCSDELVAYRRLPGEPGLTLDGSSQPVWHFDPSSPEFATALGRLIAELQAFDVDAAREAGVPVMSMSEVRSQWRADFERVRAAFEIAHPLQARWEAWFSNDRLWPERTAFTHGELYAAHVLVDGPSRIVGVLDWTTAKVGDPAVDFTYQHMMGPAAFEATVAAYIEAGGVLLPHLAERCAELAAAAPLAYGLFALQSRNPQHRAAAAAQLLAEE
ncbi:MAG: GTPase HflX [Polyangiaceae bacterium]